MNNVHVDRFGKAFTSRELASSSRSFYLPGRPSRRFYGIESISGGPPPKAFGLRSFLLLLTKGPIYEGGQKCRRKAAVLSRLSTTTWLKLLGDFNATWTGTCSRLLLRAASERSECVFSPARL